MLLQYYISKFKIWRTNSIDKILMKYIRKIYKNLEINVKQKY